MNILEFKQMLRESTIEANGHTVVATLEKNQQQCPKCGRVYTFSQPPGQGTAIEREQHLSGFCSDVCWDAALGREDNDGDIAKLEEAFDRISIGTTTLMNWKTTTD